MSKTYKVRGFLTVWVDADIQAEDEDEAFDRADELRFDSYTNGSLGVNPYENWCKGVDVNFEDIEWEKINLITEEEQ
jgi:hypothetical protein